jgi:hypothetical protein
MVPRQARLPPAIMDVARVSLKERKIFVVYSCKERYTETKICLSLLATLSKIKN